MEEEEEVWGQGGEAGGENVGEWESGSGEEEDAPSADPEELPRQAQERVFRRWNELSSERKQTTWWDVKEQIRFRSAAGELWVLMLLVVAENWSMCRRTPYGTKFCFSPNAFTQ